MTLRRKLIFHKLLEEFPNIFYDYKIIVKKFKNSQSNFQKF